MTQNALKTTFIKKAFYMFCQIKLFGLPKVTSIYNYPILTISSRHFISIKKDILQGQLLMKHIGNAEVGDWRTTI